MSWDRFWFKFAEVEERLAARRTLVLFATLWMTYSSYTWAAQYAYVVMVKADNNLMLAAAALVAAVTAPITYLQKVVFEAYITAKQAPPPPQG